MGYCTFKIHNESTPYILPRQSGRGVEKTSLSLFQNKEDSSPCEPEAQLWQEIVFSKVPVSCVWLRGESRGSWRSGGDHFPKGLPTYSKGSSSISPCQSTHHLCQLLRLPCDISVLGLGGAFNLAFQRGIPFFRPKGPVFCGPFPGFEWDGTNEARWCWRTSARPVRWNQAGLVNLGRCWFEETPLGVRFKGSPKGHPF